MQYSLICALLWATTGIFVKSITDITISQILLSRFIIAALFILFINQLLKTQQRSPNTQANFTIKVSLALLMVFYYLCATYSFIYTPIALATLLMSLSPCIAIFYKIIKGEKVSIYEIIGFSFAFLGVTLYIYPSLHLQNSQSLYLLFGSFLAFLAAVFKAINSMLIWNYRKDLTTLDFKQINLMTYLLASLVTSFSLIHPTNFIQISSKSIFLIIGLGIFATALPSILNNIASQKINPVLNTIIGMLTPLFAAIMAWLVLGEKLSAWSLFSLVVALFGVLLIVVKK